MHVSWTLQWQGSLAVLVGLQEVTAGRERAVEAGGEACDVSGDVGQDAWGGLVVVGDLKTNNKKTQVSSD